MMPTVYGQDTRQQQSVPEQAPVVELEVVETTLEIEQMLNLLIENIQIQGTVVGQNIKASAIIDDQIAWEGDIFLLSETGNIVGKLFPKERDKHPIECVIKIAKVHAGCVTFEHAGVHISIEMIEKALGHACPQAKICAACEDGTPCNQLVGKKLNRIKAPLKPVPATPR